MKNETESSEHHGRIEVCLPLSSVLKLCAVSIPASIEKTKKTPSDNCRETFEDFLIITAIMRLLFMILAH